jgi:hypothetical protein
MRSKRSLCFSLFFGSIGSIGARSSTLGPLWRSRMRVMICADALAAVRAIRRPDASVERAEISVYLCDSADG